MRRLLTFACEDARLGATLDGAHERAPANATAGDETAVDQAPAATGVLIVTGGSQTRIGSHRLFERLAHGIAQAGYAALRFDRRGVGDSDGEDPGYRGSGPDLDAAATAFRAETPGATRLIGLGLCDGATALALHGAAARLDGLVLVNPWLVEAEADAPPAAAIRQHYRQRLLSREGWQKIATGAISYRKLLRGIAKVARPRPPSTLAGDVAAALRTGGAPAALILAVRDNTAVAAAAEVEARQYDGLIGTVIEVETDSHTFARPGDVPALLDAVLRILREL